MKFDNEDKKEVVLALAAMFLHAEMSSGKISGQSVPQRIDGAINMASLLVQAVAKLP